ncbi:MAG: T9SS type A sorting domain-containing protein [Bacteroidia bacterium]
MIKQFTFTLTSIILLFICTTSNAQISYSFTRIPPGTIAYQNLTGNTIITDSFSVNTNDYLFNQQLQGEVFKFFNTLDTIGVNADIWIVNDGEFQIGEALTFKLFEIAATPLSSINVTSQISYAITGTSGNLIVKFEFKNWKLANGPPGNFSNFQIWLYQQIGVIEYHFGARSANNATGYNINNGPFMGAVWVPNAATSVIEKLWCNGNPNNPTLDSAAIVQFYAMQGIPDSGTVYRFTPKSTLTGINNPSQENLQISLYPNPTTEQTTIQFSKNTNALITIQDVVGKTILEVPTRNQEQITIPVADLPRGIYFIKITENNKSIIKKIVLM